jgi:transaldolase
MTTNLIEPRLVVHTDSDILTGSRFERLREKGAAPQNVLWASTGTKNPALPDTYYLGRLAALGTVDTVPEKTLLAYADHGVTCDLMQPDHDEARRCLDTIRAAGVDIDQLAARLQTEGAAAFTTAWNDLLISIQTKITT